jgi:hypothetical protein
MLLHLCCREPSFGHGTLDLLNATHATWSWTKNQQGATFSVADQVTIIRGSGGKACAAPPAAVAAASGR